jgi:hypothetical protein
MSSVHSGKLKINMSCYTRTYPGIICRSCPGFFRFVKSSCRQLSTISLNSDGASSSEGNGRSCNCGSSFHVANAHKIMPSWNISLLTPIWSSRGIPELSIPANSGGSQPKRHPLLLKSATRIFISESITMLSSAASPQI